MQSGRIQSNEVLRFHSERELAAAVAAAALAQRTTPSEFLRRAAREAVLRAGIPLASPAPDQDRAA